MLSQITKKIAVLAASVLLALTLGEIYLRRNPPYWLYIQTCHVVQQTHSEPATDPILGYNPILAYWPVANLDKPFRNREFSTRVKINSLHMRDTEYSYERLPGVARVVAVGDSFIFGWGVENHETVTEVLEQEHLVNTEVLNLGVSGYYANHEIERLKFQGLRFQPDIVLLFSYSYPRYWFPEYQFEGGKMYWSFLRRDLSSVRLESFLLRRVYLYGLFSQALRAMKERFSRRISNAESVVSNEGEPGSQESSDPDEEGLALLGELKDLSREHNFLPVFIYIPWRDQVAAGPTTEERARLKIYRDFCRAQGIEFINLIPSLRKTSVCQGQSPYFRLDDHWNKHGHRAAAGAIAAYLKRKGLLGQEFFRA